MAITLKAARANKGYNLDEAAALLGITKQTLCRWENQKTYPTVDKIKKIEEVYELTYNDINFLVEKV